ncbi:MAG: PLP-dependent aminotransferase family protein [Spirochaetes bacterium]|nr:MAG: PLP-dependent aminotransferase family protein [Spirochaetota bacterium]
MSLQASTQSVVPGNIIDLGLGHPDPSLLPLEVIQKASIHRTAQKDPLILQYGLEQGDESFRKLLADYLSFNCSCPVKENHLFITNGVSQALDLLCTIFTVPGDTVFVEDPTYFLSLRIFEDHGLKVIPIATDSKGLIVEDLEDKLKSVKPAFLYTIPTHQNPSGATLPRERRMEIAELGGKHNFLILADEVYHFLTYRGEPPPGFSNFIDRGPVISLGSFSKILAPGLRLGWIHASPSLLKPLITCGFLDSGGGLAPFLSSIVRSVFELDLLQKHIDYLCRVYRERLEALVNSLRREFGKLVDFTVPCGGFFLWVRFTDNTDVTSLLPELEKYSVRFMPGIRCSEQGSFRNYMRISFSFYNSNNLEEGVRRLHKAYVSSNHSH